MEETQERNRRTDDGWKQYRPFDGLIRALEEVKGTDHKIRFEIWHGGASKIQSWSLTQDEVKDFIWQTQQPEP